MKTKEIVKLTISYTDEFTFNDLGDAVFFLKLWKKGKSETVRASIELIEVVDETAQDPIQDPICSESVTNRGVDC